LKEESVGTSVIVGRALSLEPLITSCGEVEGGLNMWDCDISSLERLRALSKDAETQRLVNVVQHGLV